MSEEPLAVLRPDMPSLEQVRPYLEAIDAAGWYTNFGPLNEQLEAKLARALHGPSPLSVATVANGSLGLELGLAALGLAPGARVLLPSLTFPASANAVMRAGFVPALCDVDPDTWELTPEIAREHAREIDAVMPVAIFGRPTDIDCWDEFTGETGIPVLVDAAAAFGNQRIGRTSAAVFSMHATKAFACGEGGFVAAADPEFTRRVSTASNFGFDAGLVRQPGTNAKLSEYHAAVALAALANWPPAELRRLDLASRFLSTLSPIEATGHIRLHGAEGPPWVRSVFVVRVPSGVGNETVSELAKRGFETRCWYCPPLHEHPAFAACPRVGGLTATGALSKQLLGIPFHLQLPEDAPERIAGALYEVIDAQLERKRAVVS